MLDVAIQKVQSDSVQLSLESTKNYIDTLYNWDRRVAEWNTLLTSILIKKKLI